MNSKRRALAKEFIAKGLSPKEAYEEVKKLKIIGKRKTDGK